MAKTQYTLEQVVSLLRTRQGDKSQSALAAEIGVTPAYITYVYQGRKLPGPSILRYLGLKAVRVVHIHFEKL